MDKRCEKHQVVYHEDWCPKCGPPASAIARDPFETIKELESKLDALQRGYSRELDEYVSRLDTANEQLRQRALEVDEMEHDIAQLVKGRDAEANARIAAESRLSSALNRLDLIDAMRTGLSETFWSAELRAILAGERDEAKEGIYAPFVAPTQAA